MAFIVNGKRYERTLLHLVPHGIDSETFKPLPKDNTKLVEFRKRVFQDNNYKFAIFYNSRNVHRKRTSNIVLAFRMFCDNLSKEEAEKCVLILHTDVMCDAGTNLIAIKEAFCPENNIIFSPAKLSPEDMCLIYNLADVTVNASCIPPGHKITTKNGPKNIEKIKIGEEVLTHKGRFRPVLKTFEYDNKDCEMVKITPFNLNKPLELTAEHKIWAIKRNKMKNKLMNENESVEKYMEWIPAGELSPGDLVMYPKLKENFIENVIFDLKNYILITNNTYRITENSIKLLQSKNKGELKRLISLDNDLAYLLGKWCGDGSDQNIAFNSKYGNENINKIGNIFVKKFGGDFVIKPHNLKKKTCTMLYFLNNNISTVVNFFKSLCGNNSFNKHIPNEVLYNKNAEILQSFIDGLIDSDGSSGQMNGNKYIKIVTVSDLLQQQLIFSLIRLNKKVRLDEGTSGYKPGNTHHQIYFCSNNEDNCSSRSWFRDGYYLMSINKIEKYFYTGKVYNIETKEDNSYISCNLLVHNSNEGFGLSVAESLMCGTPISVAVTGGLQDQIGQTDNEGKPIEFGKDFGSNNIGQYKNHGPWAYPIWPVTRMVQGSIPTPYIFDDLTKWEDIAESYMYWYLMGDAKRTKCGQIGRDWCLGEGGLNSKNMGQQFINCMEFLFQNWTPPRKFGIYTKDDYIGNQMPDKSMGFPIPTIDKEALQKQTETLKVE